MKTTPFEMEPPFPDFDLLRERSARVVADAANLGRHLHPATLDAVAELLRTINCYYSNLIEGHDHAPDRDRAGNAERTVPGGGTAQSPDRGQGAHRGAAPHRASSRRRAHGERVRGRVPAVGSSRVLRAPAGRDARGSASDGADRAHRDAGRTPGPWRPRGQSRGAIGSRRARVAGAVRCRVRPAIALGQRRSRADDTGGGASPAALDPPVRRWQWTCGAPDDGCVSAENRNGRARPLDRVAGAGAREVAIPGGVGGRRRAAAGTISTGEGRFPCTRSTASASSSSTYAKIRFPI